MDQFGVLVESIGFKAHGRSSAPLADLKGTNKPNNRSNNGFPGDVGFDADFSSFNSNASRSGYNSNSSLNVDDLDGIFKANGGKPPNSGFDDVFGGIGSGNGNNNNGIDLDSVFKGSSSSNYDDDDIFGLKKQSSGSIGGVFGSKVAQSKNKGSVDDLLGDFGGMGLKSSGSSKNSGEKLENASTSDDLFGNFVGAGMKSNGLKRNSVEKQENAPRADDLLGDFGGLGMKSNGTKRNSVEKHETASNSDDLLSGFGGKASPSNGMKSETVPSRKSSGHSVSSFSADDPFVMFERVDRSTKPNNGASGVDDYLDSFFTPGTQSSTRSYQSSATEDSVYDALFKNDVGPKAKKASSGSSYQTTKASPVTNSADDFSFMFGMGDAPSSGVFQEIKGESEERRRARLNHHIRTQERMAKVLNEKNQRDLEAQREQDEKHRIAETLDADIKRWAVGKEGNLRALLSSLQYVLWSECGWQPVPLTDLITSTSVKKVYHKATLCVHPDKVQQKGATIEQKYIAEKVFDLLKEAWNKFNSEEFKKQ